MLPKPIRTYWVLSVLWERRSGVGLTHRRFARGDENGRSPIHFAMQHAGAWLGSPTDSPAFISGYWKQPDRHDASMNDFERHAGTVESETPGGRSSRSSSCVWPSPEALRMRSHVLAHIKSI